MPCVEIRCPLSCLEVTGVTIQVSSPRCWCPWYVSNRQIQDDLGVPLFADHIRALAESFDSKLADVGKTLVRQLGRYLSWPRADPVAWREGQGRRETAGQSGPSPATVKSNWTNCVWCWSAERPSATLRFSVIFLSYMTNGRVFDAKSGTAHSPLLEARRLHLSAWQTSHNSSMRHSESGLGIQTANQPKFNTSIGQPRP